MKQTIEHTTRALYKLLFISVISLLVAACQNNEIVDCYEEGVPVTLSLNYKIPGMSVLTRADELSEADASQVNDLWVGIFDATTGERKSSNHFTGLSSKDNHVTHPLTGIQTLSGSSRIVAVANVASNYGLAANNQPQLLKDILESEATTLEAYMNLASTEMDASNIDRLTPNLEMSGYYYENPTTDPTTWEKTPPIVNIPAETEGIVVLPGAIHLRRLDAYIRFELKGGTGITFKPYSWQVLNTPLISYIHEQDSNAPDKDWGSAQKYGNSRLSYRFDKTGDVHSFGFYQYENKHTGVGGDVIKTYKDREKEIKNADGTNSGVYAGLNNNRATYVMVNGEISYHTEVDGVPVTRTALVKYIIHLGYIEGTTEAEKANDFNCRRNTRYTYTVTINGANDIKVEAEAESESNGSGFANGAEGEVTDTSEETVVLDCHYTMYNIHLTDEERNNLQWRVVCPYGAGINELHSQDYTTAEQKNELETNPFYNWVRILPTTAEDVPATYSPSAWYLADLPDTDGHASNASGWYTVFFNEYAYLLDPNGATLTEEQWAQSDWTKYVNKDPRLLWIRLEKIETSPDKESTYTYAKYAFQQNSINTYYKLTPNTVALGMEHVNETYGPNEIVGTDDYNNEENGRYAQWQYMTNNRQGDWSRVLNMDAFHSVAAITQQNENKPATTYPIYQRGNKTQFDQCMTRNRDLNGDGKIDINEVKWYVPSTDKYIEMFIGANAVLDPLMDFAGTPELPYGGGTRDNSRFHFLSSQGEVFWAEEGLSTGPLSDWGGTYGTWEVRCVRRLGSNQHTIEQELETANLYTIDKANRIVTMTNLNPNALRSAIPDFIPAHTVDDPQRNNVPYQFEYASADCTNMGAINGISIGNDGALDGVNSDAGLIAPWTAAVNANWFCSKYNEDNNNPNRGVWRTPNAIELSILYMEGIFSGNYAWASCTQELYPNGNSTNQRFMGIDNRNKKITAQLFDGWYSRPNGLKLRCVRDVFSTSDTP